jgi:hypothetical protein
MLICFKTRYVSKDFAFPSPLSAAAIALPCY